MKLSKNRFAQKFLGAAFLVMQGISLNAFAGSNCLLLRADRVFDGYDLHENAEVLIKGRKIVQVGAKNSLQGCGKKIDLGNATILPGLLSRMRTSLSKMSGRIPCLSTGSLPYKTRAGR
jgi:hypothetical protein